MCCYPELKDHRVWFLEIIYKQYFLGDSVAKTLCSQFRGLRFNPRIGKIPLEKEMAIRSSTIAWTEEHGRLQHMGSHRVGHN